MLRTMLLLVFILLATVSLSSASVIYIEDFESGVGPEWSGTGLTIQTDTTPVGARTFLGAFTNGTVTLGSSVPIEGRFRISFDLYVLRSWDGNSVEWGPDRFQVWGMSGSTPVGFLDTTLAEASTAGLTQNYPFLGSPAETGASEIDTLGYSFPSAAGGSNLTDSVYHFTFEYDHAFAPGSLNFTASGLQANMVAGFYDEAWGLDNVMVEHLPEPGTAFLFGGAGLALLLFSRRRTKA